MSSFGGAKPKSSKKQKKSKLKDRRDEKEEEKDAVPLDKDENIEDEMASQNPRRKEEEEQMPANISKPMQHMITSLGIPKDLRNAEDLEKILYTIPYFPTKYTRLNDGSESLSKSGNNTKSNQKEDESDIKDVEFGMAIKNLVNVTMEKLHEDIKACPPPSSSTNPILAKVEEIADALTSVSKDYGKLSPSASDSPLAPWPPGTSVEKMHPVHDVNEQSSKISKKKSKHDKNKMMEGKEVKMQVELEDDEIPAEGEMTEVLKSNKIPPPSYNLQNEREISSRTPRCASLPSTSFGKKLPDPNENVEDEDKSSSKGSKRKSKLEGNQITEDEIPVVLEEKVEIPTILDDELKAILEKKMEMLAIWAEDEISAVLDERDKIPVDLEKEDELMKVFHKERVPLLSDHSNNNKKGEMSSPASLTPSLCGKTAVKALPDPIERGDEQDKIISKRSKKKKKKSKVKSKITEDKEDEIPGTLKEKSNIPTVFDEKGEIPAVSEENEEIPTLLEKGIKIPREDEILAALEGEEVSTTLEEDEISAVLEERDKIPVVFDKEEEIPAVSEGEDEMMEVFQNERVPPLTHHLHNNEKREISSPTHRSSTPFPRTSSDQTLLDSIGRVDNQDKTGSKGSKKKSSKRGKMKSTVDKDGVQSGLEEKDAMKKNIKNDKVPPLSGSNIPLKDNNDGKDGATSSGIQQNLFINIQYDFSRTVLLWNRWSLISDDAIRNAVKNISKRSELNLNFSNINTTWSYGIATFEKVEDAELCVKFFNEFTVNLQPIVNKMKAFMDKDQLAFCELLKFKDPELPVLAEMVFIWLTYVKVLENRTPKFANKNKSVVVLNISSKVTYEELKNAFTAFGKIKSIEFFSVLNAEDFYAANIIYSHVFEALAAMFAMNSLRWFQYKLAVMMILKFRFFGDWVERFLYPEMSNSVSFADAFSVIEYNKLKKQQQQESNQSQADQKSNRSQAAREKTYVLQKSVIMEECKKGEKKLSWKDNSAAFCGKGNESGVKEKPLEVKERAKMKGEIRSPVFRRNETSNEGKSQQKSNPIQESDEEESERDRVKTNPVQDPDEEKLDRDGVKSSSIRKSKKKGKKKGK